MDFEFEEIITKVGLYLATFLVCLVSGFLPLVNAELYLVSISAISSKSVALPVILLSTSGQMTAKSIIYLAGRGFLNLPLGKYEKKIEKVRETFAKWQNKIDLLIFMSAFLGFPPFFIVSILAGMQKLNFRRFFIFGFFGRLLRFAITFLFPQLIKGFI